MLGCFRVRWCLGTCFLVSSFHFFLPFLSLPFRATDQQRLQNSIFFRNALSERLDNPITAIPELPEGGHGAVVGIPRALGGRGAHEHGHGGHQAIPVHGPH